MYNTSACVCPSLCFCALCPAKNLLAALDLGMIARRQGLMPVGVERVFGDNAPEKFPAFGR